MKGSINQFKNVLREAFGDALTNLKSKEKEEPNLEEFEIDQNAETEEESASRERQQASSYLGAFDGEPEYGDDLPWPKSSKEEGVSQTKRSAHGYDLEEPVDYDLPGEGKVQENINEEPSFLQNAQKLSMFKSFLKSLSVDEREALKKELPCLLGLHAKEEATESLPQKSMPKLGDMEKDISNDPRGKPVTRSSQQSHTFKTGEVEDPNKLGEVEDSPVSQEKAKTIMKHGEIGDKPLTTKQKGMFGAIAGGQKLTKMKESKKKVNFPNLNKLVQKKRSSK